MSFPGEKFIGYDIEWERKLHEGKPKSLDDKTLHCYVEMILHYHRLEKGIHQVKNPDVRISHQRLDAFYLSRYSVEKYLGYLASKGFITINRPTAKSCIRVKLLDNVDNNLINKRM